MCHTDPHNDGPSYIEGIDDDNGGEFVSFAQPLARKVMHWWLRPIAHPWSLSVYQTLALALCLIWQSPSS